MSTSRFAAVVGSLLFLLLTPGSSHCQDLFGSLIGNVTDPSHAAIGGASVRITNAGTGEVRATQTSSSGLYSFPSISTGRYTVEIGMQGFETVKQQDIAIRNGDAVRIDVVLPVGTKAEAVDVTSESEVLQTEGADIRAEIVSKTLQDTPLPPGRNFQNLLVTVPGITPPINSNSVSANPARSLAYMANGASRSGNVMTIDGASVESTWLQQVSSYVPGLEAIEVVNVASNSYDAAQGFAGGAAVNVQVKSGTNQIHGSAFEYNFNNAMIAHPFFLPAGQPNPKSIVNDFGGTLGGRLSEIACFTF